MSRDMLGEILAGTLSEEDADAALDTILDSSEASSAETILGLSHTKWTAHVHGALWAEIASWRRSGWPSDCAVCGGSIELDRFGWRIVEVNEQAQLRNIRCQVEQDTKIAI